MSDTKTDNTGARLPNGRHMTGTEATLTEAARATVATMRSAGDDYAIVAHTFNEGDVLVVVARGDAARRVASGLRAAGVAQPIETGVQV